jgi:hypothetical protein
MLKTGVAWADVVTPLLIPQADKKNTSERIHAGIIKNLIVRFLKN